MQEQDLIKKDIAKFLDKHYHKELLRFVTVGSVDDGKSTLIGRLLYDTGAVYDDQVASVKKAHGTTGEGEIDYAFLLDGLKAEREQGITIDVAYRYFATEKRKFILADTPGHIQYTRNMATGASTADVALILIDARLGGQIQSRRHATIASLLGIKYLFVCINKMDLVNYDQKIFEKIKKDFGKFVSSLHFRDILYFPVSALKGDNIVHASPKTPWFKGGPILKALETIKIDRDQSKHAFAFPIQYVLRPNLDFRGYAGTIISGSVKKGDEVLILPSGKKNKVKSIVTYDGELKEANAPLAVTITLKDEVDISRGDVLVHAKHDLKPAHQLKATLVWMHEKPLEVGCPYWIKHTSRMVTGQVDKIEEIVDVNTFCGVKAEGMNLNDIGRVVISVNRPLMVDGYRHNRLAGAFILIDRVSNATVGAGMIDSFSEGVLGDAQTEEIVLNLDKALVERLRQEANWKQMSLEEMLNEMIARTGKGNS
ncbi:MAG TPA: sulfate adenylyltransferase subunit CysN [Deltaproteobacteria bacterium]|nr:MAG: sulfate adenylyltransferase subunit CysN [Deltaproteobacteria bacterium GWA2_45_12]HBF12684.1 sulfate adenylyltransferase subunit CysN [Deltaproteobacteria bacterium]